MEENMKEIEQILFEATCFEKNKPTLDINLVED